MWQDPNKNTIILQLKWLLKVLINESIIFLFFLRMDCSFSLHFIWSFSAVSKLIKCLYIFYFFNYSMLISAKSIDDKKDILSVKSAFSICSHSLKHVSYPLGRNNTLPYMRGIIKDVKWARADKICARLFIILSSCLMWSIS